MNKIVVQVRGYDPYDYNVFDTSVRGVSDEKLERYVEEAIFNAKGCIGSSDYWTMTVYVLDPETHQIDVRYEHKQPLQVRIEVNLPAKRKSITINIFHTLFKNVLTILKDSIERTDSTSTLRHIA